MEEKNNIDTCPECGCDLAEARKEEKKNQVFEKKYRQQLILIRKKAKRLNIIIGVVLFMLFPPLVIRQLPNYSDLPGIPVDLVTPTYLVIFLAYGLVGAWFGTMVKRTPRKEKKLWVSFEKTYTPAT